jgi:L-alanine-DL-glutamate epimerase-like enolase superfamily enzyme
VKEAIRIGKILEEFNYHFFEEPLPWDWYQEQKIVEQALDIPMAGGEEEFGMHAFRYLIGNEVFQIIQPDLFYFGGMVRTMKVARMTEAAGLLTTPHISGGGLGYLYMLANLEPPDFPAPIGVLRKTSAPCFSASAHEQIDFVKGKEGEGDLEELLYSGGTWEVK